MDKVINPHWKIVAIEETSFWRKDIAEKAGRIFGIYLFDSNRHVHCCEITPSHELHFLESVAANTSEEMEETLREGNVDTDPVSYYHTWWIARRNPDFVHDFGERPLEDEQTYEEALEDWIEYVRCNQHLPAICWQTQEA